ncbi:MAG: hypothetical protein Q9164_002391 [Protoblastenia rupestris]
MPYAPLPSFTAKYHFKSYPSIDSSTHAFASGKNVFITGGGAGIGASITRSFAAAGAAVISISGRTEKALLDTKKDVEAAFSETKVKTFIANITDAEGMDEAFKAVGQVDVLVHNAAYLPDLVPITEADAGDWWKGYEVNVRGSFNVLRAFLAHSASGKVPVVIDVTTPPVHLPAIPTQSAYAVSKTAAMKFFDVLQAEHPGVRVVHVSPGNVVTSEMGAKGLRSTGERFRPNDASLPADFIVWVSSSEAGFLKGKLVWANWDVDELKERKEEIANGMALTVGLNGWPGGKHTSESGIVEE